MSEHVITSLAILKANWDEGLDYIENFVPFVAECLRTAPQDEVSLPELQAAITDTFGLNIPQGALKTILNRAARHGYVRRTMKIYLRNNVALATLDFSRVRNEVLRKHEALISKLMDFVGERFKIKWSREEAEAALLSYLQERSTPILVASIEGQPISSPALPVGHADFLVNAFVIHLNEGDPEGFDYLETIVKGSMLANVLLFPDLGGVARRFGKLKVYFDTGFLLRALGLAPEAIQVPCRELIGLLYEQNADLGCFEHTFDEIFGVIDASARSLRSPESLKYAFGETLEHFREKKYQASDVELIIARLETTLRALHVQVEPKPLHKVPLGLNEKKLESVLQDEVKYRHREPLLHDLDSLTAIHRLRRGRLHRNIESCRAVFITTNSALARASARFFKEEYEGITAPLCILDHVFASLVWLKCALEAPDLPRKRIIADCYAAMKPQDDLWKKYLDEMDRLEEGGDVSEEDYHILRSSMEARSALMEVTLGDTNAFTEGTIEEVLEKARAAMRAEAEEAVHAEKDKRIEAERRAADAEAKLQARWNGIGFLACVGVF